MRIPRIYTPQNLDLNCEIVLQDSASHHLLKVLRMSKGRNLVLFNGDGNQYTATVIRSEKKSAIVWTTAKNKLPNASPLNTELAISVSKGERFEWVLQKATELGVTSIKPLITSRCAFRLTGERLQKKVASWQQITISACEQCQRNTLPDLAAPQPLDSYLNNCQSETKLVLHHTSEKVLKECPPPLSLALLIGPEGGLADEEITQAQKHGFSSTTLGRRVLRTETAPIVALSIAQFLWGDLTTS